VVAVLGFGDLDRALRRLQREVIAAQVLYEVERRRYFLTRGARRRAKARRAQARAAKAARRAAMP